MFKGLSIFILIISMRIFAGDEFIMGKFQGTDQNGHECFLDLNQIIREENSLHPFSALVTGDFGQAIYQVGEGNPDAARDANFARILFGEGPASKFGFVTKWFFNTLSIYTDASGLALEFELLNEGSFFKRFAGFGRIHIHCTNLKLIQL